MMIGCRSMWPYGTIPTARPKDTYHINGEPPKKRGKHRQAHRAQPYIPTTRMLNSPGVKPLSEKN